MRALRFVAPLSSLTFLAWSADAAELPITAITITPTGAVVTRSGTLAAGDDSITGLPVTLGGVGLTGAGLAVSIAGADQPRWRFVVERTATVPAPDDVAVRAALAAAGRRLDLAHARAELARLAMSSPAAPADDRHPAAPLTLPDPAAQQALAAFIIANVTHATADEAAALRERAAAEQRLAELSANPPAVSHGRIELDAAAPAGPRVVTVRYNLNDVRWEPQYDLELSDGAAVLVQYADLRVNSDETWNAVPITFSARSPDRALSLPELSIPVLGLGETLDGMKNVRQGGRRTRALGKFGGSKGSESIVDSGLDNHFRHQQNPDGSFGVAPWQGQATALCLLAFLGAGYDHKTPNKYRKIVADGLGWLRTREPERQPLIELALTSMAMTEAYAMTTDAELKEPAQHAIDTLTRRAYDGGELAPLLSRSGPFAGPESLTWVVMAGKSALAAQFQNDGLAKARALLPLIARAVDRDEARLAELATRIYLGEKLRGEVTVAEAQGWAKQVPRWFASGRPELIEFAVLTCFQVGGDVWQAYNTPVRDLMSQSQDRATGAFDSPHPAGQPIASALCVLSMETYYRYAQVGGGGGSGKAVVAPAPDTYADPVQAAQSWPWRFTVSTPLPLANGVRQRIELRRVRLPSTLQYTAIPAQDPAVWRSLTFANPWPQVLLSGPCAVRVDGRHMDGVRLPFALPLAETTVALGADERLRVTRELDEQSDDGLFGRTLTVTMRYRCAAPAGFTAPVTVREAMPQLAHPDVRYEVLAPALTTDALKERLARDPTWSFDLAPEATATVSYLLSYPKSLRPFLEAR